MTETWWWVLGIGVYVVGWVVAAVCIYDPTETVSDDIAASGPGSAFGGLFWPLIVAVVIVVAPFLAVGRLIERFKGEPEVRRQRKRHEELTRRQVEQEQLRAKERAAGIGGDDQ